jgi:hypothetical protein
MCKVHCAARGVFFFFRVNGITLSRYRSKIGQNLSFLRFLRSRLVRILDPPRIVKVFITLYKLGLSTTLPPLNRGYLVGNVELVGRVKIVGSRETYAKIMWQK